MKNYSGAEKFSNSYAIFSSYNFLLIFQRIRVWVTLIFSPSNINEQGLDKSSCVGTPIYKQVKTGKAALEKGVGERLAQTGLQPLRVCPFFTL